MPRQPGGARCCTAVSLDLDPQSQPILAAIADAGFHHLGPAVRHVVAGPDVHAAACELARRVGRDLRDG